MEQLSGEARCQGSKFTFRNRSRIPGAKARVRLVHGAWEASVEGPYECHGSQRGRAAGGRGDDQSLTSSSGLCSGDSCD